MDQEKLNFWLYNAVKTDSSTDLIAALIKDGADVNWIDDREDGQGFSVLHATAQNGHLEFLKILVKHGVNLNVATSFGTKDTALHIAAEKGFSECASFLVDSGIDVNIRNKLGETPLHLAAIRGRLDCVKRLLGLGADIGMTSDDGYNARSMAEKFRNEEVVAFFDAYGEQNQLNHAITGSCDHLEMEF